MGGFDHELLFSSFYEATLATTREASDAQSHRRSGTPARTWSQADQLAAAGVDGLISDHADVRRFGVTN